jgi:voltage-gated potassium channel
VRAQGPGFAIAVLALVVLGGTLGYHWIEGWSFGRALYRTVLAITTVESPAAVTRAGEVFTVLLLIGGVSGALYAFTLLATLVVEGGVPRGLERRRRARMLEKIRDHFILCGYGRIGRIVGQELQRQAVPFVVIDNDPHRVDQARVDGALALEADASSEEVLTQAGIARARGLIAAVGSDAENVYTVLSARVLRPELFIIGRAATDDAGAKLKRAGASRVVSPYEIGGLQMAQTALRPAVVDFVELATRSDSLELGMEQITVSAESGLTNRSILEANLRQRFGVIVVGIQRSDLRMTFNPEPDTIIGGGDKLVVLGRPESLRRLETEAGGHGSTTS